MLRWWTKDSPHYTKHGVVCDGAVRSGKTLCLSLSFVLWAFQCFPSADLNEVAQPYGQDFALCGKTIGSLRRNVVRPLTQLLQGQGFTCRLILSRNLLEIQQGNTLHRFLLFGGKDEGSAALIQGITLAGVLFDEVALMPRSFVEQALARCSVEGARFWFNCNPEHPSHWFYREWISKAPQRNVLYLHFTMKDNPSLSPAVRKRYETMYSGVFYKRYVLGKWVSAHGAVYPMFQRSQHVVEHLPKSFARYIISCDYGIQNPSSFGLWGLHQGLWYRMAEYYHSARETGRVKTDEEYCDALEELAGQRPIEVVLVDPSAASFISCLRRRGKFPVALAKNSVLEGIRRVSSALSKEELKFHASCRRSIQEFSLYQWDLSAQKEVPLQKNDHAMDDIRYFVHYIQEEQDTGFYAVSAGRKTPPHRLP